MTNFILTLGSPAALAICLASWFSVVNAITFAAFRIDRRRAKAGQWRVSKQTLLMLAALGGWPGAKLTQAMSRHKLHRRPFRMLLDLSSLPLPVLAVVLAAQHPVGLNYPSNSAVSDGAQATSAPTQPEVFTLTRISALRDSM